MSIVGWSVSGTGEEVRRAGIELPESIGDSWQVRARRELVGDTLVITYEAIVPTEVLVAHGHVSLGPR